MFTFFCMLQSKGIVVMGRLFGYRKFSNPEKQLPLTSAAKLKDKEKVSVFYIYITCI